MQTPYVRSNMIALIPPTGYLPRVSLCSGPSLSTNKGMDAVCCANCNALRVYYHKGLGSFIDHSIACEYLMTLTHHHSSLLNLITISTCSAPIIHYMPNECFAEQELCKKRINDLCTRMRSLNLVDGGLYDTNPSEFMVADRQGLPFIMPTSEMRKLSSYGGDEGVEIDGKELKVTDSNLMLSSGKWAHLVLYWTLINWFTGKKSPILVEW